MIFKFKLRKFLFKNKNKIWKSNYDLTTTGGCSSSLNLSHFSFNPQFLYEKKSHQLLHDYVKNFSVTVTTYFQILVINYFLIALSIYRRRLSIIFLMRIYKASMQVRRTVMKMEKKWKFASERREKIPVLLWQSIRFVSATQRKSLSQFSSSREHHRTEIVNAERARVDFILQSKNK